MDYVCSRHKARCLVVLLLLALVSGLAWSQAPLPAESPTPAGNKPTGPQTGSGEGEPATKQPEIPHGFITVLQTSFLVVPANKNDSCSSYVPDYTKYHSIVELVDTESLGVATNRAGLPVYSVNTDGRDPESGEERRVGFTTSGLNPFGGTMQSTLGEPGTRITFHGDSSHPFAPSPGVRVWDGSIDIDPKCGMVIRAKSVSAASPSPGSALAKIDAASLILQVQRLLKTLGYDPGPVDGKAGARTVEAMKEFQRREKLPVDGRVSPALLKALDARKGQ
jgi:Putative peptidoglycan binding domain